MIVVVIGTIRGGEEAWRSLITHVLDPLQADLALLAARTETDCLLHEVARYDWCFDDPEDWGQELDRVCRESGSAVDWLCSARASAYEGLWGGVMIDGRLQRGSGVITMILRDKLLAYYDVLRTYDKVIVTRSDHLYLCDHVFPSPECRLEIPVGEDWWGVTDRHHIVDKEVLELYLCVARWWMQNHQSINNEIKSHHNPEQLLALYFREIGIVPKRVARCMVTVAREGDTTRWKMAHVKIPGHDGLFLKYPHEYFSHLPRSLRAAAEGGKQASGRVRGGQTRLWQKSRIKLVTNFGCRH